MSVYVDNMRANFGRMKMCHMVADSLDELHAMAKTIGLKREWFQPRETMPHYDISLSKRAEAVYNGAIEVTMRQVGRANINQCLAKKAGLPIWPLNFKEPHANDLT